MTRGFPPPPPGRGRGRGRGRGKLVRPLAPDATDAAEASRQPIPTPPVAPAADEPPQSPLIDPTPLDPSSVPNDVDSWGILCTFLHPIIRFTSTYSTSRDADFGPLHAAMEKLQIDPPISEELLVRGVEDTLMQNIFNSYATSWLSKTFAEARVAGTQPNWLGDGIWHDLQAYWNSDEFKAKSAKNKVNRVANPVAASTVYRGGSSSVGMHKRKLEAQLGRPPNRMEVFADCYKKKADGTWSGKRAEEVVETYQKLLEERVSQPASGEVAHQMPWTTEARSSSSTTAPSPTDTKLDKIMLVLSALCTKMGMPQIFSEIQSTIDAPIDGTAQQATENATDEPEA
ncbi:UNVERIFIED_CONTAM: hypothetical protein Sangu_2676600 [Sesamum angustifolium]|uniref:Uncharacterized protein n=1 Tax=Sesamum angustifolium TaxID=2727405 RepID=A0AAW2J049_9LAMI